MIAPFLAPYSTPSAALISFGGQCAFHGWALSCLLSQVRLSGAVGIFRSGKVEVVVWALRSEAEMPEEEMGLWKWGFLMLLIYIRLTY